MLLILSVAVTAIIHIMILKSQAVRYSEFVIYISAAYTVFRLLAALFDTVKLRRLKSPTLYAAKALSLSVALMSLFSLLFSVLELSSADSSTKYIINVVTGSAVGILTIFISLLTIRRAYRLLK